MALPTSDPTRRFLASCILFAAVALAAAVAALGQTTLDAAVVGAGGAVVGDSSHRLGATLGQGLAGAAAVAAHEAGVGFWYLTGRAAATAVDGAGDAPALRTELRQNSPNPFNPMTVLRYAVGTEGHVSLALYDLQGRVVARLVDGPQAAGAYELQFRPQGLASGTYIYRLITADGVLTRRMVLLK